MDGIFDSFYKVWAPTFAGANVLGVYLTLWLKIDLFWVSLVVGFFLLFVYRLPHFLPRFPISIGYANAVTILRLSLVLGGFTFHSLLDNWELLGLFLLAICLDGVDGYLARKFGHESAAGAKLDMETDAFMVLALSWIHFTEERLGWYILIPGGLKYIFEIMLFWKLNRRKEVLSQKVRATIAVSFFLTLLIPFVTSNQLFIGMVYLSGLAIVISFLISFFSQIRRS